MWVKTSGTQPRPGLLPTGMRPTISAVPTKLMEEGMDDWKLRTLELEVRALRTIMPRVIAAALGGPDSADSFLDADDMMVIVEDFAEDENERRYITGYLSNILREVGELVHGLRELRAAARRADQGEQEEAVRADDTQPRLRLVTDEGPEKP